MQLDLDTNETGDLMVTTPTGILLGQFPMDGVWDMLMDDSNWIDAINGYKTQVIPEALKGRVNRVKLNRWCDV